MKLFFINVTIISMKKIKIILFLLLFLLLPLKVFAIEEDTYKAKVLSHEIVECGDDLLLEDYQCVIYEIQILDEEFGEKKVQTKVSIFNNEEAVFSDGSKIYASYSKDVEGNYSWNIEGYSRESEIVFLFLFFIFTIFLVNGKKGLGATLGLILTILVIYAFTIPMIVNGMSIFFVASVSVFVILLSSYLSHGFNKKTSIALLSMFIGVIFVFILGYIVLKALHLDGVGEEHSNMLYGQLSGNIKLFDILLFSIVLGVVGVLDDVTIGQVASMQELISTNKNINSVDLFRKSMNIGKDHIASMVNTLFIAYAGSSLSLVVILSINNPGIISLINLDYISEEIVRTLVASIGLVLIVPLTTFMGSIILLGDRNLQKRYNNDR